MSDSIRESCLDCGAPLELTLEGQKKHVLNAVHTVEKKNIPNFCILKLFLDSYGIIVKIEYPAGVEIIINLINPMVRDWSILSNRPILLLR
jgi:hypothetical protein